MLHLFIDFIAIQKLYNVKKRLPNQITFSLEDDDKNKVHFNDETMTFTSSLKKFFLIF